MDSQPTRDQDGANDKNKSISDNRQSAGNQPASNGGSNRAQGDIITETMELARNVGEQAWSAAANPVATAQDLARKAREQTSAATDTLYQQGARAGEYLTRNVNEYPLTALLVAGAIGYGIAYLLHSSWQTQDENGGKHGSKDERHQRRGD